MPSAGTTCKVERSPLCAACPSPSCFIFTHREMFLGEGVSVFTWQSRYVSAGVAMVQCSLSPTAPFVHPPPPDDQDLLAAKPVTEKLPPHERRMGSLAAHMAFPQSPFLPPHGPAHMRGPPERFMVPAAPFMGSPGPEFLRPPRGEVAPPHTAPSLTCCCQLPVPRSHGGIPQSLGASH